MKQFHAFMKKEFLESARTGKLLILSVLFLLFGIMNPATAKLTPWMMELMSESLAETGLIVSSVSVDALTSWAQFHKNVPVALIIFLLMFCGSFAGEYQKGTLIPILTKGMKRRVIVAAKTAAMLVFWTGGYWLCYAVTYGYNAYFWDNGIASSLGVSAACFYLFGVWMITALALASTLFRSASSVLLASGGLFLIFYLPGLLPPIQKYMPGYLLNAPLLPTGQAEPKDFLPVVCITILLSIIQYAAAVISFNRKKI